jgi:hypothetical protein
MEQINSIHLYSLRNNEHFQFMTDVKKMIDTATPAVLHLETVYPRFTGAFDALNATLLVDRGSVKTETLSEFDTSRDCTWSGIKGRLRATLLCPFEEEVASAKALLRIFDLYGNIREMSYNEETAALTNLIEDLENRENATHCNTVGITGWVDALKQQNIAFQALLDERNEELAGKESGDVKTARAAIDPEYETMVQRMNAAVTLDMATPEIEKFIRELNQRIKYYNETLAARAGRSAAGEEIPDGDAES